MSLNLPAGRRPMASVDPGHDWEALEETVVSVD